MEVILLEENADKKFENEIEPDRDDTEKSKGNEKNNSDRIENNDHHHVKNLSMDDNGSVFDQFKSNTIGTAVISRNTTIFTVIGWVCAALTAFVSPLFAIGGICFGVLLNRSHRGRGNVIIITNVVLAIINLIFGLFLVMAARRMMGY